MSNVTIIHVPVIHQGYIDFIKKEKIDVVLVIGQSLQNEFSERVSPMFIRDPRKVDSGYVCECLHLAIPGVSFMLIDNVDLLVKILGSYENFVLPDEDISYYLSGVYLPNKSIKFADTHLRWDMRRVYKDSPVDEDVLCTDDEKNIVYMEKAKKLAPKSNDWWRQIGCVLITNDGQEIVGYNRHPDNLSLEALGDPRSNFNAGVSFELSTAIHSEATAIAYAARYGFSLEGASIFVTTFPCPVCAKLIAESGIKEIYFEQGYSILDGESILKQNKVKIYRVISKIK